MNSTKVYLEEKDYKEVQTPLILNYTQAIPFMTPETRQRQVKLQGPTGEMLILRGDSTIALVIGDVLEPFDDSYKLYYDESNFIHDFEKQVIREVRQVGVEILEKKTAKSHFAEAFTLAITMAQRLCGDNIRIEVSHASELTDVISKLVNGDAKKLESLIYFLNRKNTKEAVKILSESVLGKSAQQLVEKGLTTPRALDAYISDIAMIEGFEAIYQWLLNLQKSIEPFMNCDNFSNTDTNIDSSTNFLVEINFDPSFTVDKPYYTGETFKIYDTKRHVTLITGGTYRFDAYDISGCGFSILDGGTL